MTEADYREALFGMGEEAYRTSFGRAYSDCEQDEIRALVSSSGLADVACIDAKAYLTGLVPMAHPFHRETVRTLYATNGACTAWDFKGESAGRPRRVRKIYNLFLGLCGSGRAGIPDVRARLYYVAVESVESRSDNETGAQDVDSRPTAFMSRSMDRLVSDPWEYEPSDYAKYNVCCPDEYKLTGLICKKAYRIYPDEITAFVASKGWA